MILRDCCESMTLRPRSKLRWVCYCGAMLKSPIKSELTFTQSEHPVNAGCNFFMISYLSLSTQQNLSGWFPTGTSSCLLVAKKTQLGNHSTLSTLVGSPAGSRNRDQRDFESGGCRFCPVQDTSASARFKCARYTFGCVAKNILVVLTRDAKKQFE